MPTTAEFPFYYGLPLVTTVADFPNPLSAPEDSPLAFGYMLTADLMLGAYRKGIFAWSADPVSWWSPDPRGILELDGLHVSQRLARKIRQAPFRVTLNQAFVGVLEGCALPRHAEAETWLTAEFMECYSELFQRGYAHSVECWQGDALVGGVFGVALERFFSAESMFHRVTDASKIALFYLVEWLKQNHYALVDIQVLTPHMESLGGVWIAREEYVRRLREALVQD
jgi:leucyl/phenylalanyl-tRNA--protein transferase